MTTGTMPRRLGRAEPPVAEDPGSSAKSGATLRTKARMPTLKTTSARPKSVRWPTSMAGTDTLTGYGQYSAAPLASVNSSGWTPNSSAAQSAAALMPT